MNFKEILQDIYPKITTVEMVTKNSFVVIMSVIFDQKLSVLEAVSIVVILPLHRVEMPSLNYKMDIAL